MGMIINLIHNSENRTLAYRVHAFGTHTLDACSHFPFALFPKPQRP